MLDQIFKSKAVRQAEADAKAAAIATREASISQRAWDSLQAEVRGLKSRQGALNDLSIDAENRIAKLAAQCQQQAQNFADALDMIDKRTRDLLDSHQQALARLGDLSALCRRVDSDQHALQDSVRAGLDKLAEDLGRKIAAIGPGGPEVDALNGRMEAMSVVLDDLSQTMVDIANVRQSASFENATNITELRNAVDAMRAEIVAIPEIATGIADEINRLRSELQAVGAAPATAEIAAIGERPAPPMNPNIPKLSDILRNVGAPSVEDVQRMQRKSGEDGKTDRSE